MGVKIEIGDVKTVAMGCPNCASTNLWRGVLVPGWQSVKAEKRSLDDFEMVSCDTTGEREVQWRDAEGDGIFGCGECGWECRLRDLVQLQQDGQPLPTVTPGQQALIDDESAGSANER